MAFTVGIAGITGKFGRLVAQHLLKTPNIELRGFCRTPSNVPRTISESPNVKIYQGGAFDTKEAMSFASGCDVLVCAYLGDEKLMVDGQKLLIDACEANNVPRYIASDYSIDFTNIRLGQLFPKDPMIRVKDYLETKKVAGVHVLIGGFMPTLMSPFFGLWDAKGNTIRFWGDGTEGFEASTYESAAEYTAAIALDPTATGVLRCDRKSPRELAEIFEKIHSIRPALERNGSLNELHDQMVKLREQYPTEIYRYMGMYYTYYMASGKVDVGPDYHNSRYPEIKPATWEDFIRGLDLQITTPKA
ncbi:unnamed protein product [Colletotrichum noveboracense]|uniref:NAD(P)-binding domain-containing protein n=1 Tax=Colletotrichum noveboracense TaxID=2664923 RepID=A0A9W4WDH5_9PEZI|nr:unnamed protein product [Colletotrichum noveboracense]